MSTDTLYWRHVTAKDFCPKCNGFLIHGIWNPKLKKVVSWCPVCDPDGIKDCVVSEEEKILGGK